MRNTHSAHVLSSKTEACRGLQESFSCLACGSTPYLELLYLLLRICKLLLEQVTLRQKCFVLCLCWASQADLEIAAYRRDKGLVSAAACCPAVGLLCSAHYSLYGLLGFVRLLVQGDQHCAGGRSHNSSASALGPAHALLPGMVLEVNPVSKPLVRASMTPADSRYFRKDSFASAILPAAAAAQSASTRGSDGMLLRNAEVVENFED